MLSKNGKFAIIESMDRNDKAGELLKCTKLPLQLQALLPDGYFYKLKKWTPYENEPNHFEAIILSNIYTEDEAYEWWHEFNIKSNTTMRVRATCPKTGKVNTFKIYLRCLHQGRTEKCEKYDHSQKLKSSSSTKRNTNCPAGMIIAIRRHIKYSRSKMRDPVDPVHPCEIQIRFLHKHPTNSAATLRFRPVSKHVEEKLLTLYQIGHSPSSALETLKMDLQIEYGSLYSQMISDRYHCPDKSFCYRLYYKHFGKDYSSSSKKDLLSSVGDKVLHYNTILGETCLTAEMLDNHWVVAVCTPLMKRAHSLPESGNVVYVDSTLYCQVSPGNKERVEQNILLFLAHTAAGGIPLGAVLTTSKRNEVLSHGFQLLKQLLPENAFYSRGAIGPFMFLTEDSENQRIALSNVWSGTNIKICIFRILQSMWQWLWDEKHNILKDHRLYLLYLLKTLLFASSETELNTKYQSLSNDNVAVHYPMYLQHVKCLWERQHLWGLCFHGLLPLQGASNYFEAAVRALKDKVFEVTKNFNLLQLLNYLITRLDLYFRIKFLDILCNKISYIFRSHYPDTIPPHIFQEIKLVAGNYFLVPSEYGDGKFFTVDAELNSCTCSSGLSGILCLHQFWVFLKTDSELFKVGFCSEEYKQKLHMVVTGSITHIDNFHSQLPLETSSTSLPQVAESGGSIPMLSNHDQEEFMLKDLNSGHTVDDVTSTANVLVSLRNNKESDAISPCVEATTGLFMDELSNTIQGNSSGSVQDGNTCMDKGNTNNPTLVIEGFEADKTSDIPLSVEKLKENEFDQWKDDSDVEKRMAEVLVKFEDFCQRVRDGLKSQPTAFLPALEIMMKTLERKGYSSDIITSGLSFFSVLSVPSLKTKGKKRTEISIAMEGEMIPKVHGRQMITYGKQRPVLPITEANLPSETTALTKTTDINSCDKEIPTQTSVEIS